MDKDRLPGYAHGRLPECTEGEFASIGASLCDLLNKAPSRSIVSIELDFTANPGGSTLFIPETSNCGRDHHPRGPGAALVPGPSVCEPRGPCSGRRRHPDEHARRVEYVQLEWSLIIEYARHYRVHGLSTSLDTALSTSGGKELGEVCSVLTQDCVAGLKCGPSVADDCGWEYHTCYPPADPPDELDQRCTLDPPCGVDTCSASNFCFEGTCLSFCDAPSHPCSRPREECLRYTGWVYVCVTRCSPLLQDCPEGLVCDYLGAAQGVGCLAHSPMPVGFHGKCESSGDCQPGLICVNSVIGCATDCCTPFCDVTDPNACDQTPGSACKPFDFFYPSPETENLGYCD